MEAIGPPQSHGSPHLHLALDALLPPSSLPLPLTLPRTPGGSSSCQLCLGTGLAQSYLLSK